MLEPDSREPWFLRASLSDQDIAETATVLEDSLKVVLSKKIKCRTKTQKAAKKK
jgi:hypothetical protein